jgi:hypothetical protein
MYRCFKTNNQIRLNSPYFLKKYNPVQKENFMKTKLTKCLIMGALAIGMTSAAMAAEDKQLCFQINGDINNSLQIDKIYLTVNSVGVATGNECFYSISDKRATPSCSPVIGNVTGKYPQAFLSLTGNWQTTIGQDVVSEDTKVSVHYNFKKLSGEGIAKTLQTVDRSPPQEINSSEGSVSRIPCPKPLVNPLKHLPALKIITRTPTPAALVTKYNPIAAKPPQACPSTVVTACDKNPNNTQANCDTQYIDSYLDMSGCGSNLNCNPPIIAAIKCSWDAMVNQCVNKGHNCE